MGPALSAELSSFVNPLPRLTVFSAAVTVSLLPCPAPPPVAPPSRTVSASSRVCNLLNRLSLLFFRSAASSSSFRCSPSLGSNTALSSAYGNPRCRPRICMAMMTSLEMVPNCALKLVVELGYPRDRPTVPYAETTSKRTAKSVKTDSSPSLSLSRLPSQMEMMNRPRKTYQRSKESCRRK